jgi:hypothetical protein
VATSLVQDVPKPLPPTFFRRNGEQFAYASVAITLVLVFVRLLAALFRPKKRPS